MRRQNNFLFLPAEPDLRKRVKYTLVDGVLHEEEVVTKWVIKKPGKRKDADDVKDRNVAE